ncbi:MAG: peptidoglycan-binding protein [Sandaracinaceae bacterium]|nr:peptidoglycan-binding protein [Sandaracinaceae bacterium]
MHRGSPAFLRDLQRRHGLPVTGRLDTATARALERTRAWARLEAASAAHREHLDAPTPTAPLTRQGPRPAQPSTRSSSSTLMGQ